MSCPTPEWSSPDVSAVYRPEWPTIHIDIPDDVLGKHGLPPARVNEKEQCIEVVWSKKEKQ